MKKLIVITALTALVAVGCASHKGGTSDNDTNPNSGTGTSDTGTMSTNTIQNTSPNSSTTTPAPGSNP